jgi:hypothetical protein
MTSLHLSVSAFFEDLACSPFVRTTALQVSLSFIIKLYAQHRKGHSRGNGGTAIRGDRKLYIRRSSLVTAFWEKGRLKTPVHFSLGGTSHHRNDQFLCLRHS